MKYCRLLFAVAVLCGLTRCKPMPNDGVPVYLKIDTVTLLNEPSHGISDVYVEAGGQIIGIFELPAEIPILQSGDVDLLIQAGVKDNGFSSYRVQYPFYASDTFTLTATVPGNVYEYQPQFRYKTGANFLLNEDFEVGNSFSTTLSVADAATYPLVRYGNKCGLVHVEPTDSLLNVEQINPMSVTNGQSVYAEFDFYNTQPFTVGLITINSQGTTNRYPKLTLYPSDGKWKKLYVNFSEEILGSANQQYKLYFEVYNLQNAGGDVYLDNVRFITFQ